MTSSSDNDVFDLGKLSALAARLSRFPGIKPWCNPDTGEEFYIAFARLAWFMLLSPRDRWRVDHSRARAYKRYGIPLLPEWAVGKLAMVMSEYVPDSVA